MVCTRPQLDREAQVKNSCVTRPDSFPVRPLCLEGWKKNKFLKDSELGIMGRKRREENNDR